MKLRISPTILDEVSSAIEDALAHQERGTADPTDPTYLKIDAAANAAKSHKNGFFIDADADDLLELKDRAEYNVGPGGCCYENLEDSHDRYDRAYWLGRIRAYRSLIKQIAALTKPASPSQEITMTTRITLSNTQYAILEHAIDQTNGQITWFPDGVKGGARAKVLQGLLGKALITRDGQDNLFVTAEGYVALGRDTPAPATPPRKPKVKAAVASDRPRTRENSKQATVIQMLQRPEGATISQICSATGWQAHTVRGTFAGAFKKKLGLNLTSDKADGGERIYRIV